MFVKPVSIESSPSGSWTWSDEIDIARSYAYRPFCLKWSMGAVSSTIRVAYLIAESSGGTYTSAGSGTSIILTGGTSISGPGTGSLMLPFLMGYEGVTDFLRTAGAIKIGTLCTGEGGTAPLSMSIVG